MLLLQKSYKKRLEFLASSDTFSIFGAGRGGEQVIEYLKVHNKKIAMIFDNDIEKSGCYLKEIPIDTPTACNINDYPVIIASTWHFDISKQLESLACKNFCDFSLTGLSKEKMSLNALDDMQWLHDKLADDASKSILNDIAIYIDNETDKRPQSNYQQYHHAKIVLGERREILDGGAFDALSTVALLDYFGRDIFIHAFEPEEKNQAVCRKMIKENNAEHAIKLVPKGLWSSDTILKFTSSEKQHGAGCFISEDGDVEVPVTDIDRYCITNKVEPSYIKMDIEGAEYEAILGMRDIITTHQPYLAICLYHDFDDLWRIPKLINDMNSSYEMYIGHHTDHWFETVLYCIPRN